MKSKLFSDDIPPACAYCKHGFTTWDGKTVLCKKNGVCNPGFSCRKYRYDPLKRIPKRPRALPKFDRSDFEL